MSHNRDKKGGKKKIWKFGRVLERKEVGDSDEEVGQY